MTGRAWWRVVGDFVGALVVLATIIAAYWTAETVGALWAFWALVLLAAAWAALRWGAPRVRERINNLRMLIERGREYQKWTDIAAVRQAQVEELEGKLKVASASTEVARANGILEGRRRVVGEYLAVVAGASLEPVALGIADGELLIAADTSSGASPELDSLYVLQVKGLGTVKAVLRVEDVPGPSKVLLVVDHSYDAMFVQGLTEAARTSSDFPKSLELAPRAVTSIHDFEQEGEGR